MRETQLQTRRDDNTLVLSGEIDQQNSDVLEAALRVAAEYADEMFWVDLRRVTFLEVHACRAIVMGTQKFRDARGDVILHGPTGGTLRALRLLGVHLQPHITIVKERP
jgi:anti-anti-sigma factor